MPLSLIMSGAPTAATPVEQLQGPAVQGMFLNVMRAVDPVLSARLHDDSAFRPYTLSPLALGEPGIALQSVAALRKPIVPAGTACYVRITLLDDMLFPTFARYFLDRPTPTFELGHTEFTVTDVQVAPDKHQAWSRLCSYEDLIKQAESQHQRRLRLRFLTPTSFRNGNVDLVLPIPRLVFQSYLKRFQEYHPFAFLPDFLQQAEDYLGVERLRNLHTETIKSKRLMLAGFVGEVEFTIDRDASPEFIMQAHLLADFAFFCGTGRKTTIGMGQTICEHGSAQPV